MEIGKVIGLIIKKRGLTQIEVSNAIGKSPTALSQIINGTYNANPATLEKLSNVLNVPIPILYFLTMSEDDVPEDKLELYKLLAPSIKEFVVKIFGPESVELS